ncbi:MAG: 3-keto-disaccharide hydrolase, partial [Candidatus Fervidibacter sp.]|uniref:3-keto-disaccharide hydrolase n=1 Tax=Candidatus Fervidibacter sp. TaxID=3100871 RepID=UPI00404B7EF5
MTRREAISVLGLSSVGGLAAWALAQGEKEEGFVPIFNGKDLTGFVPFLPSGDPAKTWQVRDGTIVCSGRPHGYLRTEKEFGNFILRFEYRMMEPGNSGVFLMTLPGTIWPDGVEFQLLFSEVGRRF